MELLLLTIAVLVVGLLIGIPVPFTFFAGTLLIVVAGGYDYTFLLPYAYKQCSSIILMSIPLFIFAGSLMEKGGIGECLVNLVEMFVGRIKGGLGIAMTVACGIFGAISGSGMATLSCIGSIMLPRMEQAGYPKAHSAALISSASLLGLLIPPSMNMILYAFVGGQSVLSCFVATVGPGILLIILLSSVNCFLLRKNPNVQTLPPMSGKQYTSELGKRTVRSLPALICPVIILGGIYSGMMTPTEAAGIAVLYAIPVGFFVYKGLNRKTFKEALINAGTTAGVIMIMIFAVTMLCRLFVMEDVPTMILNAMMSVTQNNTLLVLMVNLFLIVIGMIMDDTSAILLTTPILLPVVTALGIDPVHYAAIVGVNLGLGCVTPPCAPFLYLGARVGNANIKDMLAPTGWLICFAWIPCLIITTFFPQLSLFLPRMLGLMG